MRTLIDNLVLLAKMEGADVRTPEPFDLRELIDEIVESRRPLASGCHARMQRRGRRADRRRPHRDLRSDRQLVDNAFKYAPGSAVRLAANAADGGVEVTVADDGPGFIPTTARRSSTASTAARRAARWKVRGSAWRSPSVRSNAPAARSRSLRPHRRNDVRAAPARRSGAPASRSGPPRPAWTPPGPNHLAHARVVALLSLHPLFEVGTGPPVRNSQ